MQHDEIIPKAEVQYPEKWKPPDDNILADMRTKASSRDFYANGEAMLDEYVEVGLRSLPKSTRDDLADFLNAHRFLTLGSMCSGTDSSSLVADSFKRACKRTFDIDLTTPISMQCEINTRKQNFLTTMFGSSAPLFADVRDLCRAEARDVRTQTDVPVPSVHLAWVGFPCTDVSRRNPKQMSAANRATVQNKSLRTGKVFDGLIQYYQSHGDHLLVGFCENVGGLSDLPSKDKAARSNLDVCVHRLSREAGMWTMIFGVQPSKCFGMPVSRFRYWMPHMPWTSLDGVSTQAAREIGVATFNYMAGASASTPVQIEDLLLPENHPLVLDAYSEIVKKQGAGKRNAKRGRKLATKQTKPKHKKPRGEKWMSLHSTFSKKKGFHKSYLDENMPTEAVKQSFPGLYSLTQRQLQILCLKKVSFPELVPGSIDLSQALDRSFVAKNHLVCASPGMKNYLVHRCRLSLGVECLHMQGLHYGDKHKELQQFSSSLLQDLGGNAFEAIQ